MIVKLLLIAAGGAAGAIARYTIGLGLHHVFGNAFPYGTLTVNVLGCFLLGAMYGAGTHAFSEEVRMGATIGFLGALTTFSTFGLETVMYSKEAGWLVGFANVAANLLLGLLAVKLGHYVGAYYHA